MTLEVRYEPRPITISKACGMLWNCADVLPGYAYRVLLDCDLEIGRQTYAAAARNARKHRRNVTVALLRRGL
jgi:hypothetical protein